MRAEASTGKGKRMSKTLYTEILMALRDVDPRCDEPCDECDYPHSTECGNMQTAARIARSAKCVRELYIKAETELTQARLDKETAEARNEFLQEHIDLMQERTMAKFGLPPVKNVPPMPKVKPPKWKPVTARCRCAMDTDQVKGNCPRHGFDRSHMPPKPTV